VHITISSIISKSHILLITTETDIGELLVKSMNVWNFQCKYPPHSLRIPPKTMPRWEPSAKVEDGTTTHLAPVAYPPANTRSVNVARAHGGWSRLVDTAISADRYAKHCWDALLTLNCARLLATVTARRTFTPIGHVPPVDHTHRDAMPSSLVYSKTSKFYLLG